MPFPPRLKAGASTAQSQMSRSFGGGGGGFGGGGRAGGFSGGGGGRSFGGGGFDGGLGRPHPHHVGHGGSGSFLGGLLLGSMLRSSRGGYGAPPPDDNRGGNGGGSPLSTVFIVVGIIIILVALLGAASTCMGGMMGSSSIDASTVEREPLPSSATTETDYYTDEAGWLTGTPSGMRYFYEETGVQPYLYILENGSVTDTEELAAMAEELYSELFSDEGHFLVVFCDDNNGSFNVGYYIGAQAESVLDDEAITIFAQYMKLYYYDMSISETQFFSLTYSDTAERIMTVTTSPLVRVAQCVVVIVVVVVIVFIIRYLTEAKAEGQKRTQAILNTPLEEFGDKELEDLEEKYSSD